ncbi:MAG: extracellular solute-binding protein [Lachnospiraceae bacterium]
MKFKKFLALSLILAMTASMASACGKSESEGEKTKDGKITLKTVSMFGGTDPNAPIYQSINEQFMKDNDKVVIEDDSQASDEEWKAKVAADFSAGNEPDVIQFFTDATANAIVATDKLMTIADIQKEYPEYAKDTTKEALGLTKNSDEVERAVPTTGYWEGLYCNKDVFDKYNVAIPTDWESLSTAIKTFKDNDIIPIACSLNNVPHYWVEHLMLSASGADEYTSVSDKAPAGWVKGLEALKTLRDMGAFPEDTDTVDDAYVGQLFEDKKAAMQLDGSWKVGGYKDQENTVVVGFPGIEGSKTEPGVMIGGISSGFYITKKAWEDKDKRDAAVKFVMAHTSKDGVTKYWEAGGGIGKAAVEGMTEMADMTPLAKCAFTLNTSATKTVSPTDSRIDPEAYKSIIAGAVGVSTGQQSAEELLNAALQMNAERAK